MKHLEHLSIINIAGEDADEFLQGQMTQDTQSINDGLFHLTSFCNVQGRVISTALIHRSEDLFRLVLNIDLRDELSNHLQRYILRSKVNIQTSEELIFGIYQKDIKNSEEEYIGLSNDPERSVFISNNPPEDVDQTIPTNDWVECDINSMIPIISKESSLQYIPQMLNLDELKGVSFSKGCYTGQEVVARVQHRGKVKKRMYKINIKETDLVTPHSQIMDQTKAAVGNIIISKKIANDCFCLAVINQFNSSSELTVNEKSLELL